MNRQLFQYHPTIGYRFIPGLKTRVPHEAGGYLLRTNAAGFRSRHELRREKSPGTYRVLLFGDSYTAGDGVSDGRRYGDLLEKRLPGLEVLNFGLSGSGTDQQFLVFREMAREIECDLVIIAVLVENIRRVAARYRAFETTRGEIVNFAKPYFSLEESGRLELHNVPVPREPVTDAELVAAERRHVDRGGRLPWLRTAVERVGPELKECLKRVARYQPLPAYNRVNGADWKLLKAILEQWTRELEETPVVICPLPIYHYVEEAASARSYQARFRELHRPPRIRVHDPLPDFHRVPAAERRAFRFEHDCHFTPAAHALVAKSLAGCIGPLVDASDR